ncbi:MAG: Dabb family protein [Syntrophobacteraceae bacterium]
MLKHVVLLKFNKGCAESAIGAIEKGLAELPAMMPEIMEFQSGRDVVRSERSYDFALVSGFANLEAMRRYQAHPAHQQVLVKIKEHCESILIVDFEN